jgi:protein-S-isoprenylcysteine O-methyltransferase Ste14
LPVRGLHEVMKDLQCTKRMSNPSPAGPDVRYPPPLLFVAGIAAGWLLARAFPLPLVGLTARSAAALVGWLLVAIGTGLSIWGLATFRGAGTPIRPNRPASTLVTHGPFRLSRNPMYVGLCLVYLGVMLLMNSAWIVLFLPFVIATLYLTVIRHEERYLAVTFGIAYDEYRRRVRRWL